MVRALLDGRKTQTRRIINPQPTMNPECDGDKGVIEYFAGDELIGTQKLKAAVGDRLWVRETIAVVPRTAYRCSEGVYQQLKPEDDHDAAIYRACFDRSGRPPWKPSIHMPRWASRLTLIVTDVRVERLQDISEDDADAECFGGGYPGEALPELFPGGREQWGHLSMAQCYGRLWDSINGKGAWEVNPWVAAYTFTVIKQNIDQIEKVAA